MQWKLLVPGLALSALGSLGVAVEHLQAAAAEQHQTEQAHEYTVATLLPRSPQEELITFHSLLARRDSKRACFLLAEPIRPVFAQAHSTGDCETAMDTLAGKITDRARYELPLYDASKMITVQGDRATVDACAVSWASFASAYSDAGPKLGQWQLARQQGQGYLIIGWQPCPPSATTTGAPASTTGTTAPTPPATTTPSTGSRWLPTYPDGYPGVLASAIGRRNTAVCETLFTEAGRGQFAQAHGAASCAEAVTALAGQVTDAANYANPKGAYAIPGGAGRVTVDACSLSWASAKTGTRPPGPQLGRLILETQAGGIGYLIAGVQAC